MKQKANLKNFRTIIITTILFFLFSGLSTKEDNFSLIKDYTVTIRGTSNLHDWDENVETVTGNSFVNWNKDGSFNLISLWIKMEVNSIKSDKGSIMDNNTYKALKSENNPQIIFKLITPIKSIQANATSKTFIATGNLTIAGVTNPVNIDVKVLMKDKVTLSFTGAQVISMSDYKIKAPTALLGTLKTANEITLDFKTKFILIKK